MTAEFSAAVKRIILDRATPLYASQPHCEAMLPGCTTAVTEIHHRQGRGKRAALATAVNALALCGPCHSHITQHYCRDAGYTVHRNRGLGPADVPVSYRGGALVWLMADGSLVPVEEVA